MWDVTPLPGTGKLEATDQVGDAQGDVNMTFGSAPPRPPTLSPSVRLNGKGGTGHQPSRAVRFNPRLCMLASGGEDLVSQGRQDRGG